MAHCIMTDRRNLTREQTTAREEMEPGTGNLQKTHLSASPELLGKVEAIESGKSSRVSLTADDRMKVDEKGLIHGGFTFGLADYAAMVAVNDPFVVLLAAQARFLKPVAVGDRMTAHAQVTKAEGKKSQVRCEVVNQNGQKVFESDFVCLNLDGHVLGK
jgi:uncharacterized protein (TIGR00369 family)